MIELFFIVCLVSAPDDCQEKSLLYADITPMACMMGAQPELAKWIAERPNYRIKQWKCRPLVYAEHKT